jgi:hypothetical protein
MYIDKEKLSVGTDNLFKAIYFINLILTYEDKILTLLRSSIYKHKNSMKHKRLNVVNFVINWVWIDQFLLKCIYVSNYKIEYIVFRLVSEVVHFFLILIKSLPMFRL